MLGTFIKRVPILCANCLLGVDFLDTINKARSDDYQAFLITIQTIPADACIELITNDWTAANIKLVETNAEFFKTPVNIDDAVTACPKNTIIRFVFDLDLNSALYKDLPFTN